MSSGKNNDTNFGRQDGVDLKTYFNDRLEGILSLINEKDKNYNQRFDNVTTATNAALNASDRAVTKAELASEKRFDAINEFRATLADQQRTLMPRAEVEIIFKAMNDKIDSLNLAVINKQGQDTGKKEGMSQVVLVAGFISTIIGILIWFIAE